MTEESEVMVERMSEVVMAEAVSVPLAELTITAVVAEVKRVVGLLVAEPEAEEPEAEEAEAELEAEEIEPVAAAQ
jgi:hypothetical protein